MEDALIMATLGKWLMTTGALIAVAGALIWLLGGKGWLGWIGRLPGDIRIETKNGGFYFPLTTCLLLSVVVSLLLALWRRLQG
ncbi:MAG TPA: DUF2905 domain-containing protein [Luteolibacter sp.]